jgi:choline dehydrogenase-like flavoprotein
VARVDVVVVGAGTSGAVVAARLQETGRSVLLLEAGPGEPAPSGLDPFAALATPGRTWDGLTATRTTHGTPVPYWQGRGVGGTSAINGMMATWGPPADYDAWALPAWSWADLRTARRRVVATLPLHRPRRLGPLTAAFATAAADAGIALERPPFTMARRRRVTVAQAYGVTARVDCRVDSHVDRILLEGRRAAGVRLTSGEEIEAGDVVLSAGAIHSPRLLLRSGVERPGIGANLQDHPAVRIVVHLPEDRRWPDRRRLPFAVVGRTDEHQFVPMDYTDDLATGGITVALMRARSRGHVSETDVRFDQLADDRDRAALQAGLRLVERVLPDAEVPPVDDLGDVYHAAGTCRMGDPSGPDAVVDDRGRVVGYDGLRVVDASILPTLPAANPMLTCVLIAERLVERW